LNLQPLLETLSRVSDGRVLSVAEEIAEGDFHSAKIPVREVLPSDLQETALRRFARDWVRRKLKDVGVDARLEKLPAGAGWEDDEGKVTPVQAAIILSWWPRPPEPLFDRWKREVANKKRNQGPNVDES